MTDKIYKLEDLEADAKMAGGITRHLSKKRLQLARPNETTGSLLYAKYEKLPFKDFCTEVRASRDVKDFLNKTVLMLDILQTDFKDIIEVMLAKLIVSENMNLNMRECKDALFTQGSSHILAKTIQGMSQATVGGFYYDQSWMCALCELQDITRRHVVISRLKNPANLGHTSQEVYFVILILAPMKEKTTKNAVETGRTFATLFADIEFRQKLLEAHSHEEFKKLLWTRTRFLAQSHLEQRSRLYLFAPDEDKKAKKHGSSCPIGGGIRADLQRRIPHYPSDFTDGITGKRTPQKTISTTMFLYFACVMPNIAFGMLNDNNTDGRIGVKKILISQSIGGMAFAILGGQPLIILLTTAPIALYTKLIYHICMQFDIDFAAMFACIGLWNAFFLFLYSMFDACKIMKWSSRSTEEIFALFITIAFCVDAIRDTVRDFQRNYYGSACKDQITDVNKSQPAIEVISNNILNATYSTMTDLSNTSSSAVTSATVTSTVYNCSKENSLLFLVLMLGTLWLGLTVLNFTKTPYLNANKREILADYALPLAVILMSFFGSYLFSDIKLEPFRYNTSDPGFTIAPLHKLPLMAWLASAGMGFSLSVLFFMDQNITSALINSPANKLKKGTAYHWDLFVVALINGVLSMFTLPWLHGALPHSPLHLLALSDVQDRIDMGHVYQIIVRVRESRLSAIVAHVFIAFSTLLLPYPMAYIPRPVLDGLFLYLAVTAVYGNQLFDRIMLLFTEQAAYPPNHYIRKVPQRKIHLFTLIQLAQLLVLCAFGFSPIAYMKIGFPVLIFLLLPIRHKLVPYFINHKYLKVLDGH